MHEDGLGCLDVGSGMETTDMATTNVTLTFTVEHDDSETITPATVAMWISDSMPEEWFTPDDGDEDTWISAIRYERETAE